MKKLLLSGGALVATVALSGSMAFAASITNTGHKSVNIISKNSVTLCTSVNNNSTGVNTFTGQQSSTGNAKVNNNTGDGSATTGKAVNKNTTDLTVGLTNNSACGGGLLGTTDTSGGASIDTTGSKSLNVISSSNFSATTNQNNNTTWVNTVTLQGASSGSATVSGNTGDGTATSGDSSNTNGTTLLLTVSNN